MSAKSHEVGLCQVPLDLYPVLGKCLSSENLEGRLVVGNRLFNVVSAVIQKAISVSIGKKVLEFGAIIRRRMPFADLQCSRSKCNNLFPVLSQIAVCALTVSNG